MATLFIVLGIWLAVAVLVALLVGRAIWFGTKA